MKKINQKLSCLIIDDDPTITNLIEHFCSKVPQIEYCISCNNAVDGLKLISNQEFDLLFLDYNMPELDGRAILEIKKDNSKVVMITSNSEFAVDSYNYPQIIDYLLKPIKFDRFIKSIGKFSQEIPSKVQENKHYYVKDGIRWVKINLDDVLFIKSDSNYVIWQTINRSVISLMTLKDLEKDLPDNFKRIHRSYIININQITEISKENISISKHKIPIGNQYKEIVFQLLDGT